MASLAKDHYVLASLAPSLFLSLEETERETNRTKTIRAKPIDRGKVDPPDRCNKTSGRNYTKVVRIIELITIFTEYVPSPFYLGFVRVEPGM